MQPPDALNAYKAAGVYALAGDSVKAFRFLELALDKGWTEAKLMAEDPYFDHLRIGAPEGWRKIRIKAYAKETSYKKTLKQPDLRESINKMTLTDQQLRFQRVQATDQSDRAFIDRLIHQADSNNLVQAKNILKKYGWPKISQVGTDGQNNFWLVVQHADADIPFQRAALKEMEKLKGTTEINPENYAFLYDRVQCNLNYKQWYGTQVKWTSGGRASGFRPILKEDLADQRRAKLGLLPLHVYALTYGFDYTPISKTQADFNDRQSLSNAKKLTDSAAYYFKHRQFQKAYDACNNASMIEGGMDDKQNYRAALLFARIAALDRDPKYKDISIDFLNLLKLQDKLSLKPLQVQKEFRVLHQRAGWKTLIEGL